MRRRTGCFALVALLLLGAAPTQQQIESEKEKLAGVYELYGLEIDGKIIDAEEIRAFKVTVTRKGITIKANAHEREYAYRLDPTKDPKTIDLIFKGKDGKEVVTPGIYSINGDKFKLCLAPEGSRKRPNDFETRRGSQWRYFNLHREKR